MLIRVAQEADAPAMGNVMVTTYLAAHRGQMSEAAWEHAAREWSPADSAASWLRSIREIAAGQAAGRCLYVAEDEDGAVVGVALGGPEEGGAPPGTGAVLVLYVLQERQGRGAGRGLVRAVAAHLAGRGLTALRIGCLAANAPARAFYEAIGGRAVGERQIDEGDELVAEVVYEWSDIRALAAP